MANTILNFHFDYWHPSLMLGPWWTSFQFRCFSYDFSIKHDLARSCFQLWPKIGDEGDKISREKNILHCRAIVKIKELTAFFFQQWRSNHPLKNTFTALIHSPAPEKTFRKEWFFKKTWTRHLNPLVIQNEDISFRVVCQTHRFF